MNIKKISKDQPSNFEFNSKNLDEAQKEIKKYPEGKQQSAVMPLLYLAQKQNDNWIPLSAMKYIANLLSMPYIKVYEVATFYSMYNLSPVGKFHIEVCTTTPCMLRGSDPMLDLCKKKFGLEIGGITEDGLFSLGRVECLGACVNAPVVKINENYYEDLDLNSTDKLINNITNKKKIKIGSQSGRKGSEPRKVYNDKKR